MELSKESRWKSQLGIKGLIQSTLVISISKGLSEILRDIRSSTYQICRIEEKIIQTTTFNKYMCNWTLVEVRGILKILWKRGELRSNFSFFRKIFFYLLLDFYACAGTRFSLRDKHLIEISEVEITRVNCIFKRKILTHTTVGGI